MGGSSLTYEEFISNDAAVADRGKWLVHLYPKDVNGDEEIIRLSRGEFQTWHDDITVSGISIPKHTAYIERLASPPTLSQTLWRKDNNGGSVILGNSLPSFGNIKIHNEDGGLDQYHPSNGYTWKGCRCEVLFCDKKFENIASTIRLISTGFMSDPEWTLSDITIPTKGLESQFDQPLSERVYRGTSYCLELTGDKTVSYGTPAPVNITGALTVMGWRWFEAFPSSNRRMWGWFGGTLSPWVVYIYSNATLTLAGSIAGAEQAKTTAKVLSTFRWYHFAFTVSSAGVVKYYLWDEDAQTLTKESIGSFTSGTRQANSGGTYVLRSVSGDPLKFWSDEDRVYNVELTEDQIKENRHKPLSSIIIPSSCVHLTPYDDGTGTTSTDLSATAANGTISGGGTHTWLWAMEGAADLAGTLKPDCWGPTPTSPILIDPFNYAYQVAGAGAVQQIDSQEGGLAHTMDATAADLRTFITTTPVAGHSLRYHARGMFKLGAKPTLPITADVQGYNDGPLGFVNTPAVICRDMITRRGPKLSDPADLDTASFTAFLAATSSIGTGLYVVSPMTVRQALDFVVGSGAGWWGYQGSSRLFHVEQFAGPAIASDHSWTQRNIKLNTLKSLPPQTVVYKVVVKFRHRINKLSEEQVAVAVKGAVGWQQWTLEWLEEPASDDAIREKFPGDASKIVTIETGIYNRDDAQVIAQHVLSVLKGQKYGWSVDLTYQALESVIGETEDLTVAITKSGTTVNRLNLDGGSQYIILATDINRLENIIHHDIWG